MAELLMNTLGQRILETARRAVALHMQQVAAAAGSVGSLGQRVVIGRAGPHAGGGVRTADRSKDGRLPQVDGDSAHESPETEDDVSASPPHCSAAEGAD